MLEKRRFRRFDARLPVRVRIFDSETDKDITNDIDLYTQNVSQGGMRLFLPKGWDCDECNNCLGWMYNQSCKLKNNHTREDAARPFPSTTLKLELSIGFPFETHKEPLRLSGSFAWIDAGTQASEPGYSVGISLSEGAEKQMSRYLLAVL